jgi:hypothetical protein
MASMPRASIERNQLWLDSMGMEIEGGGRRGI